MSTKFGPKWCPDCRGDGYGAHYDGCKSASKGSRRLGTSPTQQMFEQLKGGAHTHTSGYLRVGKWSCCYNCGILVPNMHSESHYCGASWQKDPRGPGIDDVSGRLWDEFEKRFLKGRQIPLDLRKDEID